MPDGPNATSPIDATSISLAPPIEEYLTSEGARNLVDKWIDERRENLQQPGTREIRRDICGDVIEADFDGDGMWDDAYGLGFAYYRHRAPGEGWAQLNVDRYSYFIYLFHNNGFGALSVRLIDPAGRPPSSRPDGPPAIPVGSPFSRESFIPFQVALGTQVWPACGQEVSPRLYIPNVSVEERGGEQGATLIINPPRNSGPTGRHAARAIILSVLAVMDGVESSAPVTPPTPGK